MTSSSFSPGVGRRCRTQLCQREDLRPGRRTPPGPEGAARPQRQGDGALLRWGPLRPQRSWETWRKDRHLEGGVEREMDKCESWTPGWESWSVFDFCTSKFWRNYLGGHMKQQVYIKHHRLSSFSCLLWSCDLQFETRGALTCCFISNIYIYIIQSASL